MTRLFAILLLTAGCCGLCSAAPALCASSTPYQEDEAAYGDGAARHFYYKFTTCENYHGTKKNYLRDNFNFHGDNSHDVPTWEGDSSVSFDGQEIPCTAPSDASSKSYSRTHYPVKSVWLFGISKSNVLDTYLSPLEYAGPALSIFHSTERLARWGRRRVTVQAVYHAEGGYLQSPTDDGKVWDGRISAAGGWHYNWHPADGLRLALGGLAELSTGFTYNTRNGNNPAQGRLDATIAASAIAEYSFPLFRRRIEARAQLDVPLIGAKFTPNYGQSYYELFSLGHYDKNVRVVSPFNAPSARLLTTLTFPLLGARISVGYLGDIRQHELNNLKYHSWNHAFVIGYVRRFVMF